MIRPRSASPTCSPFTRTVGATRRSTTPSPFARYSIFIIAGSTPAVFTRFRMRRTAWAPSDPPLQGMYASKEELNPAYEGWRVAAAASAGVFLSFASVLVYTFGVFLKPLSQEFGWSRQAVSAAFGIAAMTVA